MRRKDIYPMHYPAMFEEYRNGYKLDCSFWSAKFKLPTFGTIYVEDVIENSGWQLRKTLVAVRIKYEDREVYFQRMIGRLNNGVCPAQNNTTVRMPQEDIAKFRVAAFKTAIDVANRRVLTKPPASTKETLCQERHTKIEDCTLYRVGGEFDQNNLPPCMLHEVTEKFLAFIKENDSGRDIGGGCIDGISQCTRKVTYEEKYYKNTF